MKAWICTDGRLVPADIPEPQAGPDEALLRVRYAGICRSDRQVLQGLYGPREGWVLGHECSAEVVTSRRFESGTLVAVNPLLPDGGFLGIDRPGCFAEFLAVPEACLFPLPPGLDPLKAAAAEPVAACGAILLAPLQGRIAVAGSGRIRSLCERILRRRGFSPIAEPEPASCDWVIETDPRPAALRAALELLRPGGSLILKSRHPGSIEVPLNLLIERELKLEARRYLPFDAALALLTELDLSDLLAPPRPAAELPGLIESDSESHKLIVEI
ncbi:MAG: hypothetical protein RL095_170 [Verrucomicrobiota bacterium]|jgi:threonine dehydrogenase-like Zn-dependent dehydrogenase